MALTDIAGGDLEEMLREEAEDVFYDDGRLQPAEQGGWGRVASDRLIGGTAGVTLAQ